MELTPYFKSYIDSDKQPIVICDIDCHIVYINPAAAKEFEKFGGYDLVGRQLRALTSIEGESKINMLVELFKESKENDTLFVCRDTKKILIPMLSRSEMKTVNSSDLQEERYSALPIPLSLMI